MKYGPSWAANACLPRLVLTDVQPRTPGPASTPGPSTDRFCPGPEHAAVSKPQALLGAQTLTDSFLVFLPLSLLAKKCPRIMRRAIYSSGIRSGAFWNELATGEFLSVFFLFTKQSRRHGSELSSGPEASPALTRRL